MGSSLELHLSNFLIFFEEPSLELGQGVYQIETYT
jgi:hypothetical protein